MDADGVEISKPGESSFGAAAKDVKITTTIDTLVKGMLIFHHDGEDAALACFHSICTGSSWCCQYLEEASGTTVKQSKTGLLALDNHDTEMVGKELLNLKKLDIRHKSNRGRVTTGRARESHGAHLGIIKSWNHHWRVTTGSSDLWKISWTCHHWQGSRLEKNKIKSWTCHHWQGSFNLTELYLGGKSNRGRVTTGRALC